MIIFDGNMRAETNRSLAEDILIKMGYEVGQDELEVRNVFDVTSQLSTWGIPWTYKD